MGYAWAVGGRPRVGAWRSLPLSLYLYLPMSPILRLTGGA